MPRSDGRTHSRCLVLQLTRAAARAMKNLGRFPPSIAVWSYGSPILSNAIQSMSNQVQGCTARRQQRLPSTILPVHRHPCVDADKGCQPCQCYCLSKDGHAACAHVPRFTYVCTLCMLCLLRLLHLLGTQLIIISGPVDSNAGSKLPPFITLQPRHQAHRTHTHKHAHATLLLVKSC